MKKIYWVLMLLILASFLTSCGYYDNKGEMVKVSFGMPQNSHLEALTNANVDKLMGSFVFAKNMNTSVVYTSNQGTGGNSWSVTVEAGHQYEFHFIAYVSADNAACGSAASTPALYNHATTTAAALVGDDVCEFYHGVSMHQVDGPKSITIDIQPSGDVDPTVNVFICSEPFGSCNPTCTAPASFSLINTVLLGYRPVPSSMEVIELPSYPLDAADKFKLQKSYKLMNQSPIDAMPAEYFLGVVSTTNVPYKSPVIGQFSGSDLYFCGVTTYDTTNAMWSQIY